MGSVGNSFDMDKAKADLKQARIDYRDFLSSHSTEDGDVAEKDVPKMLELQKRIDELTYEVHKRLSPTVNKDENWKGANITALTREEASTVRHDMLKNKDMFLAIQEAAHGVAFEEGGNTYDTAVDKLYKSDKDGTYSIFKNTRSMLKKKYGDTVTLYRVGTSQTPKTTINMTSTKANAEQYAKIYGGKVKSIQDAVKSGNLINMRGLSSWSTDARTADRFTQTIYYVIIYSEHIV